MKQVQPKDCIKQLKRKDQTTIFRLRTQHIPLNSHLNRINPEKPPHCVLCDHPYETVEHVLFDCKEVEDLRFLYLPSLPTLENTLYCSREQLENTALFYNMTCVRRANAQRHLDQKQTNKQCIFTMNCQNFFEIVTHKIYCSHSHIAKNRLK